MIFNEDLDLSSTIECEAEKISPIFFYYNNFRSLDKNKYKYYNTKIRKEISNKIISIINSYINISFGITGGKGTGKTTLLYFLSSLHIFNILYLNIHFFYRKPILSTKAALKFEVYRMLCRYINSATELKDFYNLIDELNEEMEFFHFLNKLINELDNFVNKINNINSSFIIIIDQFSHEIIDGEAKLRASIMNLVGKQNISIIFCSTLNKDFANNYLYKTLTDNYNYTIDLPIHYFQKLFSDEEMKYFIQEDGQSFSNLFQKFNLPYFYYFLKDNNYDINNYESMIYNEILSFYDKEDYFSRLIDLIDIVKNNYLITPTEFIDLLKFLPLKYMNIKKKQITSSDFFKIINNVKEKDNLNILLLKREFLKNNLYNNKNNEIFKKYFHCDEINEDLSSLIKKKKYFISDFTKNLESLNYLKDIQIPEERTITILKLEFLFPYVETIIYSILYNYLKTNFKNMQSIIDKGSVGGLFEILVIYNILKNRQLGDVKINDFLYIDSLVPNNYSIKNHSYSKRFKNKFKNSIDLLSLHKNSKSKIELSEKVYGIIQNNFNGKYFDFAIIIKKENSNKFILKLFQITIHKGKIKLYIKTELELMSYFVKNNLEFFFNINIVQVDFYFIFSSIKGEIQDKVSYAFAKKHNLGFIPFCLNEMEFSKKLLINNDKAKITDKFPIHNEASLIKDENNNNYLSKVKNSIEKGMFLKIDNTNFAIIKNFFIKVNLIEGQIIEISNIPNNSDDTYNYLSDFSFVFCERKDNITSNKNIIFFDGKAFDALNGDEIKGKITFRQKTTLYCSTKPLII